MEKIDKRCEKEYGEEECVSLFLGWFNKMKGTKYKHRRTENKFPELEGRPRWDFVAEQDGNSDWIGLEVKEVTSREYHTVPAFWDMVFKQVNKEVGSKLRGTFSIHGFPNLIVDQKKQQELAKAISQVILEVSKSAPTGGRFDIWPRVTRMLSHWPSDCFISLTTALIPWRVTNATLYLQKVSDEGCIVRISVYTSSWVSEEVDRQAIEGIFSKKKGRIWANSQLALARSKGAHLCILLIDAVDWHLEDIRTVISAVPRSLMSSIDAAYLIDVPHGEITEVWPNSNTSVAKKQYFCVL